MHVDPIGVADILAEVADLREAVVAIGLHFGVDGFEEGEPESAGSES